MIISVITPVKDDPEGLRKSASSLLSQRGVELEHIIVSAGHDPELISYVEEYAPGASYPVRLIEGGSDGVYKALNLGIEAATGELVATMHAGDLWQRSDSLSMLHDALSKAGADLAYGDLHYVDSRGKRVRNYCAARFRTESLLDGFMPPHPTILARRELFATVGLYDQTYGIAGDFDWLVRTLLKAGAKSVYVASDLVAMRTGGISCKWRNRLYYTLGEKYMSLRNNGYRVSRLRLLKRYLRLFDHH